MKRHWRGVDFGHPDRAEVRRLARQVAHERATDPTNVVPPVPLTAGNRAVESVVVQRAPMVVGPANDPAEREADRAAERALGRLPSPTPQPQHGGRPAVGLEGGALGADIAGAIQSRRGGGRALDATVRSEMETAMGADLGGVRVHTDQRAAELSRAVSARAFTIGRDVFFGNGSYQPETDPGKQLLAHELAHTVQQGATAHRTADPAALRRWAIRGGPVPWDQTTEIRTVTSGQAVFFFHDASDDRLVVKADATPIGMATLASGIQKDVARIAAPVMKRGNSSDVQTVRTLLGDEDLTTHKSWKTIGQMIKADASAAQLGYDKLGDAEAARAEMQRQLDEKKQVHIMEMAQGETAKQLAPKGGTGQTSLRTWLGDGDYLYKLGEMSAVDLFLNNADRILSPNFGNWLTTSGGAITAIDNVDKKTDEMFQKQAVAVNEGTGKGKRGAEDITLLAKGKLDDTAKQLVKKLLIEMEAQGDEDTYDWADQRNTSGMTNKAFMEANIKLGLVNGRKRLIRRFASHKGNVKGRAAKKAIKKLQQGDETAGATFANTYWETLKARARWLQAH
jgi:hypothetical protein